MKLRIFHLQQDNENLFTKIFDMQSLKISLIEKKSPDGMCLQIIFEGMLTLQNAEQIKEKITKASGEFDSFDFITQQVTAIDVSFLKIIKSFKDFLEKQGKKVNVKLDLPFDSERFLCNAGIIFPL